jgi:hypothetical protein
MHKKKKVITLDDYTHEDLQPKEGEDPRSWLQRNAHVFLSEVTNLAFNPENSAKVRLDSLKTLLDRSVPVKSVYEVNPGFSEIDKMSDSEVKEWLKERLDEISQTEKS